MNERTLQLYKAAHVSYTAIDPSNNMPYETKVFSAEKFAELIVRDCAKFLDENSGYDNANNAFHPEPEDLLEQFGIK